MQYLEDLLCDRLGSTENNKKRNSGDQVLLRCSGPSSTLFDGSIGRNIGGGDSMPQAIDLLLHYTWKQGDTPNPYVAMFFNQPLVELPNITMYFYHQSRLDIQPPFLSMCFSRSLTYTPCINIGLPERPDRLNNRVLEWPVTLLTNATSVTFLRIDMWYEDSDDSDQFIFLSEIRVAERLQGRCILYCMINLTS